MLYNKNNTFTIIDSNYDEDHGTGGWSAHVKMSNGIDTFTFATDYDGSWGKLNYIEFVDGQIGERTDLRDKKYGVAVANAVFVIAQSREEELPAKHRENYENQAEAFLDDYWPVKDYNVVLDKLVAHLR